MSVCNHFATHGKTRDHDRQLDNSGKSTLWTDAGVDREIWKPLVHMNLRKACMDQSLGALFSGENLYGPMALKVRHESLTRDWHWSMDGSSQQWKRARKARSGSPVIL